MKAIRKSDGKIIDVEIYGLNSKNCPISYHANFKDFYKPEDIDFNIPKECLFDWQSFRAEAAKDILCSIIRSGYYGEDRIVCHSELAVKYTDELIKQLKEKEEK